ncbi:hypothetical protein ABBQ38_014082 [Trebouxia sp. C0009 RCD-2024]
MQCVQHHLLPEVPAHSSKPKTVARTRIVPMQDMSCMGCNSDVQRSSAVGTLTVRDRRTPVVRATMQEAAVQTVQQANAKTLLCTSVTASSFAEAITEIEQIAEEGADLIELRLDMLTDFSVERHLQQLLATTNVPKIVTMRPVWEGGKYDGPEPQRLAVLKYAALLGASHVDVELKVASYFFAGGGAVPAETKVILSSHNFDNTPSDKALETILQQMWASGADVAKIATTATDITDCARVLTLLKTSQGPCIALCMGDRGQPTRMLAAKYGGYLTFGSLGGGKESAPGQPTLRQLRQMYRLPQLTPDCQVFGVIGNPVAHSRSPQLHNAAMEAAGLDSVYLPFLVDDLRLFLTTYSSPEYGGFSVTIPHKLAALECADEVDSVAQQIGAVNTLVRQQDGSLKGYNTDWSAAITAIEQGLQSDGPTPNQAAYHQHGSGADSAPTGADSASGLGAEEATTSGRVWSGRGQDVRQGGSVLEGRTVVVVGAGGAGRALAFGAAHKGAKVIIANRSMDKAEALASQMATGAQVVPLEQLNSGEVKGDVLANTTSIGMHPHVDASPVSASAVGAFELVFDAVYTPMDTQLLKRGCLKDAAACRASNLNV